MDALLFTEIRRLARRGTWNRVFNNTSILATSYRTDLDISGRGYLLYVATIGGDSSYYNKSQIRLTIDGGAANLIGQLQIPYGVAWGSDLQALGGKVFVLVTPFRTALKVETYNAHSSSNSAKTEIHYVLS